jgi:hypothetical protein
MTWTHVAAHKRLVASPLLFSFIYCCWRGWFVVGAS